MKLVNQQALDVPMVGMTSKFVLVPVNQKGWHCKGDN